MPKIRKKGSFQKGHPCLHKRERPTSPMSEKKNPPMKTRSGSVASYRETYFIAHLGKIEGMWNEAFLQHKYESTSCYQPHFSMEKKSQSIISMTMQLLCRNCHYRGSPTKLFNEIEKTLVQVEKHLH